MNVWIVLQIIGQILLALLLVILILILLVLLVPIRYKGQGCVEDPDPHESAEWERIGKSIQGALTISWFGPLLRLQVTYPAEPVMDLRIAWLHVDPMRLVRRTPKEPATGAEESAEQMQARDRIRHICRKADYYKRLLQKEETGYSIERLQRVLLRTLRRILPRRWEILADIGLGDPAATARVLEVQGLLYPLLAGHVQIHPEFLLYQMNVQGSCKGRIRLITIVVAALWIVLDRRIMRTFRRIRNADRNIAAHYEHRMANGG